MNVDTYLILISISIFNIISVITSFGCYPNLIDQRTQNECGSEFFFVKYFLRDIFFWPGPAPCPTKGWPRWLLYSNLVLNCSDTFFAHNSPMEVSINLDLKEVLSEKLESKWNQVDEEKKVEAVQIQIQIQIWIQIQTRWMKRKRSRLSATSMKMLSAMTSP